MATFSYQLSDNFKVHAIQTGSLAVKTLHKDHSGPAFIRLPRILLSNQWTEMLPVWTWLIESPEGRFLIDTGEVPEFNEDTHFAGDTQSRLVHRRIMRLEIEEQAAIDNQLAALGVSPRDIDAIILTHLHIDHTDGLKRLEGVETMVGKREWEKQWGSVPSTWPSSFSPSKVVYKKADHPFGAEFPLTKNIRIVPTPGHTHGHQSVLLDLDGVTYMFAGDTSFNQQALLDGKMAGINIDFKTSRQTRLRILEYASIGKVVYLPTHDPDAAERLERKIFMRP